MNTLTHTPHHREREREGGREREREREERRVYGGNENCC